MESWLKIYRNFDDDALAALASAGLVRRAAKDVEAGKVAWESAPAATPALLRADGQLVRVDAGGPAKASCDCPAPSICKHILAAAIWLRDAAPSADASDAAAPSQEPAQTAAPEPVDALAEVLALAPAAIFRAAGAAATRKAAALVADTKAATITGSPGVLLVQLPALDLTCRYIAGGGFAGMVSEAPSATRAVLHLLALAAVWHQHGVAVEWPGAGSAAGVTATDVQRLGADELQLLQRLRLLIEEICQNGWSHISEIMPAQLRAMAMSARVESFPRLGAMLRSLAGTTALLTKRDINADERQAIRMATRVYALTHALSQASGERLRELRGAERRSFDGGHTIELLPLGAHWWEQRSGAHGLTLSFWDPSGQRIMQAALARRDATDRYFNRTMAWQGSPLWAGAGGVSTLANVTLSLQQVRLSDDQRISLSGETSATTLPPWSADDQRWQAAGYQDWNDLAKAIRGGAGLLGETVEMLLLKPASFDKPVLDEYRQLFNWTLRDPHGQALTLRLSCDPVHHQRIDNIEGWAEHASIIKAVLVRLERNLHGGRLEPVSLIIERQGVLRAISLDYEAPTTRASLSLMQRIGRMLKSTPTAAADEPLPPHTDWLEHLQLILENKALTGRLHLPAEDESSLRSMQSYLHASGLDLVAATLRRYLNQPSAASALALLYLCQTCAELNAGKIGGPVP